MGSEVQAEVGLAVGSLLRDQEKETSNMGEVAVEASKEDGPDQE